MNNQKSPRIWLVGGGTGGHIMPLYGLAKSLLKKNSSLTIIVADQALDRHLMAENFSHLVLKVHYLTTGKWRRYLAWENFSDLLKIAQSTWTSYQLLRRDRPQVIFFKAGFVGLPVWLATQIPFAPKVAIASHESDLTPGVITRLVSKSAQLQFSNFGSHAAPLFFEHRSPSSSAGNSHTLPKLLVMGGSQGARFLNDLIIKHLPVLTKKFLVTLITGPNNPLPPTRPNFTSFSSLPADKLAQLLQKTDLVVARAGANTLLEIIAANKPSLIIPLPSAARDHQTQNANYCANHHWCYTISQRQILTSDLPTILQKLSQDPKIKKSLSTHTLADASHFIASQLIKLATHQD